MKDISIKRYAKFVKRITALADEMARATDPTERRRLAEEIEVLRAKVEAKRPHYVLRIYDGRVRNVYDLDGPYTPMQAATRAVELEEFAKETGLELADVVVVPLGGIPLI